MIEISSVRVDCPYCGLTQKVKANTYPTFSAVFCDAEGGGCDKLFVYRIEIEPKVSTRKVYGEE